MARLNQNESTTNLTRVIQLILHSTWYIHIRTIMKNLSFFYTCVTLLRSKTIYAELIVLCGIFLTFNLNVRIFYIILSVMQNIALLLNNVMCFFHNIKVYLRQMGLNWVSFPASSPLLGYKTCYQYKTVSKSKSNLQPLSSYFRDLIGISYSLSK